MKLDKKEDTTYFINSKKDFNGLLVSENIIQKSFEFAYEMAYGDGFHRRNRTGGKHKRNDFEIFLNTFQGKIAEFVVHHFFNEKNYTCSDVDLSINEKGVWDDIDLIINNKKIGIKSTAFFSNLFLLESKDWDKEGKYIPNKALYDYFILVRIKPSTNSLLNSIKNKSKKEIQALINAKKWLYDIPGCLSNKTLKYIIKEEYILPKGVFLNGKTPMDAENYYLQTGSLKNINSLFKKLNL